MTCCAVSTRGRGAGPRAKFGITVRELWTFCSFQDGVVPPLLDINADVFGDVGFSTRFGWVDDARGVPFQLVVRRPEPVPRRLTAAW